MDISDEEWFWNKVIIGTVDDCWPWTWSALPRGYGQTSWNGEQWRAHRLAWTFAHGPIPDGSHVLHKCNNPPCCNPFSPDHLYLGTHLDNMRDKIEAGHSRPEGFVIPVDEITRGRIRDLVVERGYRVGFVADVLGVEDHHIRWLLRQWETET